MRRVILISLLVLTGLVAPTSQGARADACDTSVLTTLGALPASPTKCGGLQPGQQVASSLGRCTLNFLFTGSDGNRYMGVAGHCVITGGEQTWAYGSGPVASTNGSRIGEWVYAVLNNDRDISMIRLDSGVAASGEIMHFGGPTGLYTAHDATPSVLYHYGQISDTGTIMPGRSMVAPNTLNASHVAAVGTGVWRLG